MNKEEFLKSLKVGDFTVEKYISNINKAFDAGYESGKFFSAKWIDFLHVVLWALGNLISTHIYSNWSDEFARTENEKSWKNIEIELSKHIDWNNLTEEDCQYLKFGTWSKDSDLRLIPVYLYNLIPIGFEVISINNEHIKNDGTNLDDDQRHGYLAYGIIPKKNLISSFH